jgi:hypothetical protein
MWLFDKLLDDESLSLFLLIIIYSSSLDREIEDAS